MTIPWVEFLHATGMQKTESLTEVSYECESTKGHALDLIQQWQNDYRVRSRVRIIGQHAPDNRSLELPQPSSALEDMLDHFLTSETFRLAVMVDKHDLRPVLDIDCNLLVFSDVEATMEYMTSCAAEHLESTLFPNNQPTVIYLFLDSPIYVTNGALTVCSVSTLEIIDGKYLSRKMGLLDERRRLRNENVRWNTNSRLTPDHLIFPSHTEGADLFVCFCHFWAAKLCVIFLASYTFLLDDSNFMSVFSGWREVRFESTLSSSMQQHDLGPLFKLYNWVYGEKTPDKLSLLQQTVSSEIDSPKNDSLDLLIEKADDIFRLTQNGFRKYIQKSISDYLQERKQLEDFVKATNVDVSQQLGQVTDLMTKNLTGVLTAALASTLAYYSSTWKQIVPIALYATGAFVFLLTLYLSSYSGANVFNITRAYRARIALFRKSFVEDRNNTPPRRVRSIGRRTNDANSEMDDNTPSKATALQIAEYDVDRRLKTFWWFFGITLAVNVIIAIGAGGLGFYLQKIHSPTSLQSRPSAEILSKNRAQWVGYELANMTQFGGLKSPTHH